MIRRRLATATALAAALAVAPQASSAGAADEPVGALISMDGLSFSTSPSGSIFPAGVVLIPGSSATSRFWVRNPSEVPAELRVAADASATVGAFLDSLTISATTPTTPASAAVPLTTATECTPLLAGEVLEPGATTEVQLVLALSADAGNEGQGATAEARLAVALWDASAGSASTADCEAGAEVLVIPSGSAPSPSGSAPPSGANGDSASPSDGLPRTTEATAAGPVSLGAPSDRSGKHALPTLSLAEHPAFYPWVIAGATLLGAAAVVLIQAWRRRTRDAEE